MAKILVAYASKYGQTEKEAQRIARELELLGAQIQLLNLNTQSSPLEREGQFESFDGAIICGPFYAGKYPKPLEAWVKRNQERLNTKPCAFVSICLGVLQTNDEKVQTEEKAIVSHFLGRTGWKPAFTRIIPGGLPYTRYNWITRWIMKRISKKAGGDLDTSRDFDYSDALLSKGIARDLLDLHQNQNS